MADKIETNVIYCGDSKDILKKLPDNSVDLIYLDPPFFSHKHYEDIWADKKTKKLVKAQFSDKAWEKLKKSIRPDILEMYEHIEQRWKGGRRGIYVYIAYMRERIEQCWRVLKPTGSLYFHCDWHAEHYIKVMLDEVFGYNNFHNEIIWQRTGAHNDPTRFGVIHDNIFFYSKTDKYTFNPVFIKHSDEHIRTRFNQIDNVKRRFFAGPITAPGDGPKRKFGDKWLSPPNGRHWSYNQKKIDELLKNNLIYFSKTGTPYLKQYMDDYMSMGRRLQDVWTDILPSKTGHELLGYPTQKPEKLMERIISASSDEGDIVLDPFCGCGTTLAVAKRLNRKFIGIDISRTAGQVVRERLGGDIKFIGGETEKDVMKMNPHQVANLIIQDRWGGIVNPRKSGDLGIDGWVENRTIPVQVKRWQHKVGRPEIDKFKSAIERDRKVKGIIVAKDFSKDSYAEVARIKKENNIDIDLVRFNIFINTHNRSHSHNHGKEYIDHPAFLIL